MGQVRPIKLEKPFCISNERSMLLFLDAMVPISIHDLAVRGGPSDSDFARASEWKPEGEPEIVTREQAFAKPEVPRVDQPLEWIAHRADDLMYGGAKKGERGTGLASVAQAIAIMSYCPMGVTFYGKVWDCGMPAIDGTCGEIRGVAPGTVPLLKAIQEEKLRAIHVKQKTPAVTLYVTVVRTRHRSTRRNRRRG